MKPDIEWIKKKLASHNLFIYGVSITDMFAEVCQATIEDYINEVASKKISTDTRAGIKYEGVGIELNIDTILRVMLWQHYYYAKGSIEITRDEIWNKPWRELNLSSSFTDRGSHVVTISCRNPNVQKPVVVPEAEYEIINEPATLPVPIKLLPSFNANPNQPDSNSESSTEGDGHK